MLETRGVWNSSSSLGRVFVSLVVKILLFLLIIPFVGKIHRIFSTTDSFQL